MYVVLLVYGRRFHLQWMVAATALEMAAVAVVTVVIVPERVKWMHASSRHEEEDAVAKRRLQYNTAHCICATKTSLKNYCSPIPRPHHYHLRPVAVDVHHSASDSSHFRGSSSSRCGVYRHKIVVLHTTVTAAAHSITASLLRLCAERRWASERADARASRHRRLLLHAACVSVQPKGCRYAGDS